MNKIIYLLLCIAIIQTANVIMGFILAFSLWIQILGVISMITVYTSLIRVVVINRKREWELL